MLRLKNITKDYVTKGVPTVHALRGISLNFRRREFVAILGQSGCGKTTTLNIIGGLDRYTDGDLVIEGRSTKEYSDRDWDTYRNHSVGFVFQSYNLIMHQTVLKNVELALTISGVDKKERKARALSMLKRVGLEGMENKKPNQLSGGQMQRVAIARALINNPEILLADEPTGALDSETSVQIMDLLKEVASNCLVIMVTHNPDLAKAYATRIVTMSDGNITSDSNPYEGETVAEREAAHAGDVYSKGKKKKSSMSFLTATGLSFSNLLSKLSRTILVSIAGSIGIIGVSTVLSVSNGVSTYISSMQGDMMSAYPLTIAEESVDYTSLLGGLQNWDQSKIPQFDINTSVGLDSLIKYLMEKYNDITSVKTNDINDELLDFVINGAPEGSYTDVVLDYGIDMTNNVYTDYRRNPGEESHMISLNGLTQMYISELKTVKGFSQYAAFVDLFTDFMKEMPKNEDYILSQYDLVGSGSRFATAENEIMLVVDAKQTLTDLVYAQLGYYNETDFLNLAQRAIEENKENPDPEVIAKYKYPESFTFDEILGKKMAYYPHDAMWEYDSITHTYVKFEVPEDFLGYKIAFNVYYHENTDCLEGKMIVDNSIALDVSIPRVAETPIVDPDKPWIGSWFLDFGDYKFPFLVNADNTVSTYVQTEQYTGWLVLGAYTTEDKETKGYMYPAFAEDSWVDQKTDLKIVGILKPKADVKFGCLSRGVYYTNALAKKMMKDAAPSQIVTNDTYGIQQHIRSYLTSYGEEMEAYQAYVTYPYTSWADPDNPVLISDGIASALNTGLSASLSSLISIGGTSTLDLDIAHLRSLSGLKTIAESVYEGITTGYHFDDLPATISIYLEDFAQKDQMTAHLDTWNKEGDITVFKGTPNQRTLSFEERSELTYTDTIGMIVAVVNYLINAITIALVIFVSLALVVSCFMIAVITFISTMERVKEIGVIRSLGGRKLDVSRLFIAECLITGLSSGLLGVAMTYVISAIANLVVTPFGISTIAVLAPASALIMIGLSVLLNVLSGLIPSMRASNQDPVKALRTE